MTDRNSAPKIAGEIAVQSNYPASSKGSAHLGIEVRDADGSVEQVAVHVREPRKVLVELRLPPVGRRVEHLEQAHQPRAEVGAIGGRALFDEVQEDVARLEDARVVGEQAEHDPHQEQLQVVTVVAGRLQRVVLPRDQLGRLDVDRVLIAERPALHADDEPELLQVLRQVGECEAGLLAFVPVEKLECLEVAEKLEAGALAFRRRVEVRAWPAHERRSGRARRSSARPAGRPGPNKVDEAGGVVASRRTRSSYRATSRRRLPKISKNSLQKLWVSPFSYVASAHSRAKLAARVRISFHESLIAAVSRSRSIQKAQDRDHSSENRECLRQHRTRETPRQTSFEGGQIRALYFTQLVEVGAGGQLAALVGGGVLSDIDHGDGKRLVGAGGSQHPHGRRGVLVGSFFLAEKESGREFTAEDEQVLVLFAAQAATAIANARTH